MIFLSIGSNINSKYGNRFDNIKKTILFLNKEKIKINNISSFFETPSYPNKNLPKFINIAVEVKFFFSPFDLLKKIRFIEKKMGRVRSIKNAPRTCDIDIIDFDNMKIDTAELKIPHKSIESRNFVLYPLKEICPKWKHPISNKNINFLIDNLDLAKRNEITKIDESAILK